jgi:hypothetical protein
MIATTVCRSRTIAHAYWLDADADQYVRSHSSISPTGAWQVVRCEIRFGDSEALLLAADRSLAMTVS